MRLLAVVLSLAACGSSGDTTPERPDAGGSIVYPCAVTLDENCRAAYELATAVCDRRLECDPLYEVDRTQCIAWEMEGLCSTITCYSGPYERFDELQACIAEYSATACDESATECHL